MRAALLVLGVTVAACTPTRLGTIAITRPLRVPVVGSPSLAHEDITITTSDELKLDGWLFPAESPRGLVVLLHGKDINRQHFASAANRFHERGFVVLAYDQRAHGRSEGSLVTYGVREAPDLHRAIDVAFAAKPLADHPGLPVFLIGESLGAAVVLMEAAHDARIAGVVAGAPFADLKSVVADRTPFFLPNSTRDDALAAAELEGQFKADDASPLLAAPNITASVLLLHGSEDTFIPMRHSLRIYEALKAPKRFLRLEGVAHADILLHDEAWAEIEKFVESVATNNDKHM